MHCHGFGPIDGTGTSDMLMRNTNTGAFDIYDIPARECSAHEPGRERMVGRRHRNRSIGRSLRECPNGAGDGLDGHDRAR
jgi:hypothetical protein